ncbi:MAG: hypothetical protein R3B48_09900 [Kofleriaceae bacterium]
MASPLTTSGSGDPARLVRGALFVDYVRIVKRQRAGSSEHLEPEDLAFLMESIDVTAWYPMATFERFGLAILEALPGTGTEAIRLFGRAQLGGLLSQFPTLLVPGYPRDSLMRLRVLMSSFFSFPALDVLSIDDTSAEVTIQYGMCADAERAASWQTLGFFEGLLSLSGAAHCHCEFLVRSWETPGRVTRLRLLWVDAPRARSHVSGAAQ